jgi:hypothetical protein
MKTVTVNFSDIAEHNSHRLDAKYWIGKKNGKKAYVKDEDGLLKENDISGRVMLDENEVLEYNEAKQELKSATQKFNILKDKLDV